MTLYAPILYMRTCVRLEKHFSLTLMGKEGFLIERKQFLCFEGYCPSLGNIYNDGNLIRRIKYQKLSRCPIISIIYYQYDICIHIA
jgi:hypothetical protein